MLLVRYSENAASHVGVLQDDTVYNLADLVTGAPSDMIAVIESADTLIIAAKAALEKGGTTGKPLSSIELLSPIARPGKFICLGLNYLEHTKESGKEPPEFPTLFLRVQTSLLPPTGNIVLPKASDKLDYEAELLVVIGKRAKDVSEADALDYVFGYSAFNDGSLRDYQKRTSQWTAGKNFDATGPFGPAIATADSVPAGASGLSIRSRLNGEIMQDGNTSDMVFSVARIVADASQIMTLEPGDLIAMGTPSGVGFARNPQVFMKDGDLIEIEIEGLPTLSNKVVAA